MPFFLITTELTTFKTLIMEIDIGDYYFTILNWQIILIVLILVFVGIYFYRRKRLKLKNNFVIQLKKPSPNK